MLTPKDEAFLISFDVNVDLLSDFTNNAHEIKRAIDKASINTASSSAGRTRHRRRPVPHRQSPRKRYSTTPSISARMTSCSPQTGRKVLVILTDGEDQGSQETIKTAMEAAQKANTIVYPILIADRGFYGGGGFGYTGDSQMQQLARETGGRVINVGNNGRKLEDAFDQIQDELRTQYLLSYTPTDKSADGKYRKIEIDCGKGNNVQARKGYYAVAGDADTE